MKSLLQDIEAYKELRNHWVDDAILYAKERLGLTPTWQQAEILQEISKPGAKVTCRSGHGIGKTGATAMAICWFLETREYPKIPCTAPTSAQLRDILWAEIAKWARYSNDHWRKLNVSSELWFSSLFTITRDRVYDVSAKEEWYAVARTSGKDNPDALQGFHASNVVVSEDGKKLESVDEAAGNILFIIEEASGVYEKVFEVAEGALSSHGARLLMLGNPTRNTGYFADSHKKDRGQFKTLHFKSSDSPLVSPDYRKRLIKKYGEGSNVVRVRVDGEFPKIEDDVLIGLEAPESAINREKLDQRNHRIKLGVDVARFGNDRTCFVIRQGDNILYIEVASKKNTMWTAGKAIALTIQFNVDDIYVDVVGVGAGVADSIREKRPSHVSVIDVNVACASPDRTPGEIKPHLLRDYLWVEMARWVRRETVSFADADTELANDLAGELSVVRYGFHSSGALKVMSKDEMKKELGFSPDIADSLGVTFDDSGNQEIFIG